MIILAQMHQNGYIQQATGQGSADNSFEPGVWYVYVHDAFWNLDNYGYNDIFSVSLVITILTSEI